MFLKTTIIVSFGLLLIGFYTNTSFNKILYSEASTLSSDLSVFPPEDEVTTRYNNDYYTIKDSVEILHDGLYFVNPAYSNTKNDLEYLRTAPFPIISFYCSNGGIIGLKCVRVM